MDNMDSIEKRKVKEMLKDKEKGDQKLDWLYKPNKPDSEEYLLGKRIDKHIEESENAPREDDVGAIFSDRIKANIALDQAAKMREDPLFAIRKSEESARKRLLENPVKMKQLQMLAKQHYHGKEKKKAKKHKHKHKKDKRQYESESDEGDDDLVKKYLSIINKKQRKSTDERGEKYTKTERRSHKERSVSPEDDIDRRGRHFEYESKKKHEIDDRTKHSSSQNKHKIRNKNYQSDSESDDNRKNSNYGLSGAKNKSQPIRSRSPQRRKSRSRSRSPKRSMSKSSKHRPERSPPPRKLTAEDRDKKLREMMDNAKMHVKRREKNVHRYKEEQKREEAKQMKHAEEGANFINPLMSKHAAQSSVEDRIKRNAYNIQRTKAAMDKHFTKE